MSPRPTKSSPQRLLGEFADVIRDRGWRDPGYTALDLTAAALSVHPRPLSARALARATAQLRVRNELTLREVTEAFAPLLESIRSSQAAA